MMKHVKLKRRLHPNITISIISFTIYIFAKITFLMEKLFVAWSARLGCESYDMTQNNYEK